MAVEVAWDDLRGGTSPDQPFMKVGLRDEIKRSIILRVATGGERYPGLFVELGKGCGR